MAGVPGTTGQTLSFSQIMQLWTNNGGNSAWAPLMAAVAIAESGGITNNLNNNASTGDFSVGLWQINYFGALGPSRAASYGQPAALASDPNAQAKAAVSLFGDGSGWTNWQGDAAIKAWQHAGSPKTPSATTVLGWGVVPGGNQAAGPGPGQAGFAPVSGGTQTDNAGSGTATATLTGATSDNIAGVPDQFPAPPDASANPITDLQRTVSWFGQLIGWAFLVTLVYLFGMVLISLGTILLVMILAGPAIGPVTAAVGGKSPEGRLIAGVAGTVNKGRKKKRADREYDEDVRAASLGVTPKSRRAADKDAEATGYREGFGTKGPAADSRPSTGGRVRLSDGSWF